jgi:hypothetical protein
MTDNRELLAVCVQAFDFSDNATIAASAISDLTAAFQRVRENPLWAKAAPNPTIAASPPELALGCPSPPAVYDAQAGPSFGDNVSENVGRPAEQASPYALHVYILPHEEIQRIVGGRNNFHGGTEEVICYGDQCFGVTTGLYFSPEELADMELVVQNLNFALGLR